MSRFSFLLASLSLFTSLSAQEWTQMASPVGNGRHHPITVANDQYGYVLAAVDEVAVVKQGLPRSTSTMCTATTPPPTRGRRWACFPEGDAGMVP